MEDVIRYYAQADTISLATAAILLIMSILTWAVILLKHRVNHRRWNAERHFLEQFWRHGDPTQIVETLPDHAPGRLARVGLEVTRYCTRSSRSSELDGAVARALRQALDAENVDLEYGQTALASISSTAPFVGLFGTVWSVHHALLALGSSGQATLGQLAGPVGEALVMTGAGLAVAIPAVIAFNLFTRANRLRLVALDAFAYDLHTFLLTGMRPWPGASNALVVDKLVVTTQTALAAESR
jgi:biopolymer transport protein ExbB